MSGAWREITDRARDLGTRVRAGDTRHESGLLLESRFPACDHRVLAATADRHVFGPGVPGDEDVLAYWADVDTALKRMRKAAPRWRRSWAWLSPASLPWLPTLQRVGRHLSETGSGRFSRSRTADTSPGRVSTGQVMSANPPAAYASLGGRVVAYLIDSVMLSAGVALCYALQVAGIMNGSSMLLVIAVAATVVIAVGYPIFYIALQGRVGMTPGKRVVGLRTVDVETGEPIGFGRAFLRQLILGVLGPSTSSSSSPSRSTSVIKVGTIPRLGVLSCGWGWCRSPARRMGDALTMRPLFPVRVRQPCRSPQGLARSLLHPRHRGRRSPLRQHVRLGPARSRRLPHRWRPHPGGAGRGADLG